MLSTIFNENMVSKYGPKYTEICGQKIEKSLSSYHDDVADAILYLYGKSLDTIYNNIYTIIYEPKVARIYEWNYETKLWERYDEKKDNNHEISPKEEYFIGFITILEEIRRIIGKKVHESIDDAFRYNGECLIKKITILIGKCKTVQYKNNVWKSIIAIISKDFIRNSNNVSRELPLNDGTLYNIVTGERRIRTPDDYYTYLVPEGMTIPSTDNIITRTEETNAPECNHNIYLNVIRT